MTNDKKFLLIKTIYMERKITLKEEMLSYEAATKTRLTEKIPVLVRIDGRSFKTFTRDFRKPFDPIITKTMQMTLKKLCEDAHGCIFGYTTSDEMIIILTDYHKWNSSPWLNYEVQKICSLAASMATEAFNRFFKENKEEFYQTYDSPDKEKLYEAYCKASEKGTMFNATCFNVPEDRVCEMIYWRQLETRRNSIQALGRQYFTRNELIGKCNDEILDMLKEYKHVDWYNMPVEYRIGSSCTKGVNPFSQKKKWCIDRHMPMLCAEDRIYLQKILDSIRVDNCDDCE